jgi:hypothetical protein
LILFFDILHFDKFYFIGFTSIAIQLLRCIHHLTGDRHS